MILEEIYEDKNKFTFYIAIDYYKNLPYDL